jgi:hypothetical protein
MFKFLLFEQSCVLHWSQNTDVKAFAWTVGLAACGKIHASVYEYDHLTNRKWLSLFNFYLD